jgi:hypothetical protein
MKMQIMVVIKATKADIKIFCQIKPLINIQLSETESAPLAFIKAFIKIIIKGIINNNKVIIANGINRTQFHLLLLSLKDICFFTLEPKFIWIPFLFIEHNMHCRRCSI